ncbi:glycosyltransferase [Halochromatium sp.]
MSALPIDLWLSLSTQALSILPLGLMGVLGLNLGALVFLRFRGSPVDRDSSWPPSTQALDQWPSVVVQIPIFNEGLLVRPCLEAVAALDYPPDRLSIQLLDDSNDGSAADNLRLAGRIARESGLQIDVLRRADRAGFKAGALAAGLARSNAELAAVLDVDFTPAPDFLRRALQPLMQDPSIGFVQARWGHRNPGLSWLTRAQATLLDAHFRVEQAGRYCTGLPIAFNGTCGVWRTAVITNAGGWQGDTLSEDLDLSLRTQLAGYRGVFLDDVPVPGELLTSARAWQQQQFRWTKGHVQVLRKLGPRLLRAPWPPLTRLAVLLQIAQGLFFPLAGVALLLSLPGVVLENPPRGTLAAVLSVIGLGGLVGASLFLASGRRLAGCSWPRSLLETVGAMILLGGLLLSNSRAALEGLAGRPSAFIRSDKPGARSAGMLTRLPTSATALPAAQTLAGLSILGLFLFERAWNAPFLATTALGLLAVALPQLQGLFPIRLMARRSQH